MSDTDESLKAAAELADALTIAAPTAALLAEDAPTIEAAIERAVRVVRQLQPNSDEPGGAR